MDGSSPWASADDDSPLPLPLPRPPSPLPSFGAASSPIAGGGGWGDDGGWGAAVDDYSTTTSSAFGTSSNAVGFEETTEDLDEPVQPAIASPVGSYGGGWGTTTSPPRPSLDLPPRSPPLDPSSSAATSNPRAPSPPGFAPSSPPASPPASAGTAAAAEDTSAESEEGAGGWGGHGSPDLPPIATLKLAESPTETRSKGWGGEDEWQPPEIPAPLPSFGDAFGGVKEDQDQEEGGWGGGGQAAPSWSLPGQEEGVQDEEGEQSWNDEASQGVRRGKSIPAALVDGLKVESRQFARSTWPVSQESWGQGGFQEQTNGGLMEPPTLPPPSPTSSQPPITNDTPLPSLFKLTPTLFPKFQTGLTQTAARSAETLKGTNSTAYRNARFGGRAPNRSGDTHQPQPSPGERGHAGDEFDLDAPGASSRSTKSPWWGPSGGQNSTSAPSSAGIPDPVQVEQERSAAAGESPDPAPSAIGRFIGRFKRPTNNPVTQAPSRPSMEQEPEAVAEWHPRDLDALEAPPSRIAKAKREEAQMGDALDDFFGDTRASTKVPTRAPVEEFGGLMGAFADAPRKVSKPAMRKRNKALDPFDPFADGDDDDAALVAAPAIVPAIVTSPTRSSTPRVGSPASRPLTPQSPRRAVPEPAPSAAVASFHSPLVAPQARGVSTIASNSLQGSSSNNQDDSFDAFFNSVASSSAKPSSAPPLVSPPVLPSSRFAAPARANAPPRISTLSPPPRASTISPPSSATSSSSPLGALAPPPPPSQPLNRSGGFGIAPAPSAPAALLTQKPIAYSSTPSPPIVVAPPKPKLKPSSSGALSKEDWAFFEG